MSRTKSLCSDGGVSSEKTPAETQNRKSARQYETPVLICYGDVRDITLGPTFGGGESGCEGVFRVGPGGCPTP